MSLPKGNWGFRLLGDGYFTDRSDGKGRVRMSKGEYIRYFGGDDKYRLGVNVTDDELKDLIEDYDVEVGDLKEIRRGKILPEQLYDHLTLNDNMQEIITTTYWRFQVIEKVNKAIELKINRLYQNICECENDIIED